MTIFISYRRDDCRASVRSVAAALIHAFGPASVYLDTDANRVGDAWPERIEQALAHATIVLVAMGPSWLRISDADGRRRIDDPTDWVRREIATALDGRARVIPMLLQGALLPGTTALPEAVRDLTQRQVYEIRDDHWDRDLGHLISDLADFGCRRVTANVRYPRPHVAPAPLTGVEMQQALAQLEGWTLVTSVIPGQEPKTRTEFMKSFQFKSFDAALQFMNSASAFIERLNHHPRWENVFRTVTVWLTTWDIGFCPSSFDVDLARRLDELHIESKD
jgi:pterin-4a-carbinolamine dehydratase